MHPWLKTHVPYFQSVILWRLSGENFIHLAAKQLFLFHNVRSRWYLTILLGLTFEHTCRLDPYYST